jgi:2-keto-4-pentenoate hydratase/2-oxohepta-3-ene-1,7-dioic acid hydratase in catechol pathway
MWPYLVTLDEFDYNNAMMIVHINGQLMAEDNSKDMYHKLSKIIARISEEEYLYPGDHCFGNLPPWARPGYPQALAGDVLELEIEGIGRIRNKVMRRPPEGKGLLPKQEDLWIK